MWSFCTHTVTVFLSQLFSRSNFHQSISKRGLFYDISLFYHADKKNADGNTYLATTSHTLRTYMCIKPKQTLTREGDMIKSNTDTTVRTAKSGFLRTIWPGGRHNAGDAASQLLCIPAVDTYQLMTYDTYTTSRQTARRG